MAPKIMWPEMNAHYTTRFGNHFPCSLITNRENALMGLNATFPDIVFEPVCEPLWDEDEFLLSTTLGVPEGQSPLINI